MDQPFISSVVTFPQSVLDTFQSRVQGAVIAPDDARYAQAQQAWNLLIEQHPALIVVAKDAADVAEAVHFANAHGLRVAIQATGHGVARPADNALLINTSQMTGVRVNAEKQTAWVEAGTKWKAVLESAHAVGLAPLLGSSPDVGAIGYTLGGGMGWLARKYGMSVDSVNWFEIVTPDGRLTHASATENPDLFWGLRGGGGNFGVVTAMEIKLYPVKEVFAGNLIYPATLAKEIMTRFREWVKTHPDELTASVALMNFPPLPEVPDFLRGQSVVMVRGAYVGSEEEGAKYIQEWLDWQAPMVNMWHMMPFDQAGLISNEPEDPTPAHSTGMWLRDLTDEAIDTLVHYGVSVNGSSPLTVTEIRHAGGAIARVPANVNAYSNRDAELVLQMIAFAPSVEIAEIAKQYMEMVKRELQPALTGKVYLNFTEGEERRARTPDGFSTANYQRLQVLKTRYDRENHFDYGFEIPPSSAPKPRG